jgi:hypothetical protein
MSGHEYLAEISDTGRELFTFLRADFQIFHTRDRIMCNNKASQPALM